MSLQQEDLNPVAFLGEIINENVISKSAVEAIRDKNWFEATQTESNSLVEK